MSPKGIIVSTTPSQPGESRIEQLITERQRLHFDSMMQRTRRPAPIFIPERDPADLNCYACGGKLFKYGDRYYHARGQCEVPF